MLNNVEQATPLPFLLQKWTVKTLLGWNDDPRDVLNEFEATVTKRSSPSSEGSSTSTSAVTAAYPHRIADWIEQYYPQWSIKNDSPTSSSLPQMPRSLAHPASAVLENPQNSFSPSTTQSHITSSSSTTTSPLLSDAEAKLQRDHADQHHHHATSHLPIQRLPNRLRPVPWATSLHLGAALEMLAQCYSFKEQHDISLALYMRALQLITDEETAEAQVLAEKRAEGSASSSSSSSSSTSSSSANGGARRRDRNIFMKGVTLGSDERDCRKAILSNNIGNSMLARGDILEAKRWTEKGFKCADVAGHDCAETKVVIMHNLARILEVKNLL